MRPRCAGSPRMHYSRINIDELRPLCESGYQYEGLLIEWFIWIGSLVYRIISLPVSWVTLVGNGEGILV